MCRPRRRSYGGPGEPHAESRPLAALARLPAAINSVKSSSCTPCPSCCVRWPHMPYTKTGTKNTGGRMPRPRPAVLVRTCSICPYPVSIPPPPPVVGRHVDHDLVCRAGYGQAGSKGHHLSNTGLCSFLWQSGGGDHRVERRRLVPAVPDGKAVHAASRRLTGPVCKRYGPPPPHPRVFDRGHHQEHPPHAVHLPHDLHGVKLAARQEKPDHDARPVRVLREFAHETGVKTVPCRRDTHECRSISGCMYTFFNSQNLSGCDLGMMCTNRRKRMHIL